LRREIEHRNAKERTQEVKEEKSIPQENLQRHAKPAKWGRPSNHVKGGRREAEGGQDIL